jgi:hypothetical protein
LVDDCTHLLAFPSEYSSRGHLGRDWETSKGGTQYTMRYAQDEAGIPVEHHWAEDME